MENKIYKVNVAGQLLELKDNQTIDRYHNCKWIKLKIKIVKSSLNKYNNLSLSKKVEFKNKIGYYG